MYGIFKQSVCGIVLNGIGNPNKIEVSKICECYTLGAARLILYLLIKDVCGEFKRDDPFLTTYYIKEVSDEGK